MNARHDAAVVQETLASVGLGKHFQISDRGLTITGAPSFVACEQLWETLLIVERVVQLAIGDAMKYFRERWDERAAQIVSHRTGWSLNTLRAYEWAAEKVAPDDRRLDVLTYSHHAAVAKLAPPEQRKYLTAAADGDQETGEPWTVARLKAAIKAAGGETVTAWFLLVVCESEPKRAALQKRLELEGYQCKPTESRKGKV